MPARTVSADAIYTVLVADAKARPTGGRVRLYVRELEKAAGVSRRSAFRALATLEAQGAIVRDYDRAAHHLRGQPLLVIDLPGIVGQEVGR